MKTTDILEAIDALNEARRILYGAEVSIAEEIRIGGWCSKASIQLRQGLERDCPDVKLEAA